MCIRDRLRGVLTRINGRDAREVAGDHWVVRGDRGLTYSATPPERTRIVAGEWWPEDYAGPPLMSFAREEAEEMGLKLGDRVTVNVLGRDIEAERVKQIVPIWKHEYFDGGDSWIEGATADPDNAEARERALRVACT